MKCPACGYEIADDHLYCEKCGKEIQIVPDFEPEIENSIIETLTTVAEQIDDTNASDNTGVKTDVREDKIQKDVSVKEKGKEGFLAEEPAKNWFLISLVTFIAVMVIAAFTAVFMYHRYSTAYQVEQAKECAADGNLERAVEFLEKARTLEENPADIVLLEAGYLYQMGEGDRALEILLELIDTVQLDYDKKEKAYENVVAIYSEQERFKEINSLLNACTDDSIRNQFQQYMALAPEFGYISGTYDEIVPLKLSANTTGKIYYTTDGSEPDESSEVYTAPLFLESGEYQIAAIFVNDYGIKSEVARGWYVINLVVPDAPEVLLYSGDYHEPTLVEVNVPEEGTVYYTIDGSTPSDVSNKYTEPIQMPLGKSNFKFVTISDEGVSSEVVSRSFDFSLNTDVTVQKAVDNVVQALFERKVLLDLQGHSHEIQGKYVFRYDTIVKIPDLGYYYVLNEYIEDTGGNLTKTDRLYAVEIYTGAPNRLIYDANGEMGLIYLR